MPPFLRQGAADSARRAGPRRRPNGDILPATWYDKCTPPHTKMLLFIVMAMVVMMMVIVIVMVMVMMMMTIMMMMMM